MADQNQIERWVTEAVGGDRFALAKLLTVHHPQLRAWAASQMEPAAHAREGPDDIIQDVYLEVARQVDRFEYRGPGSFLQWVYAIGRHKLADARRAAHYRVRDVNREVPGVGSCWDLLDAVYIESGTPSRTARRAEAVAALHGSLATLPEPYRQILEWRFLEGLPVADVARRLGKSEGAVVALTRRALTALRAAMDRLGEFTHGG